MTINLETLRVTATTVSASATLQSGRHTPVDAASGPITMTLPVPTHPGVSLSVEKIDTSANTVTVTGSIRGATNSITLNAQYQVVQLHWTGATWRVTGDHRTKTQLDAAYQAIGAAAGGDLTGTFPNPTLAPVITGATVGSSSAIPVITFNSKGLITSATTTAAVSGAGVVLVPLPSGDTTGSTDRAAIQAVINASPADSTIVFQTGTYYINAPIVLIGSRNYVGSGWGYGPAGTRIKQANGANITNSAGLTGLLVPQGWTNNEVFCDAPIGISNLTVDGNRANNTTSTACGIIIFNFSSKIDECYITNAPKHGIHLTDVGANGTTVTGNSAGENRISRSKIENPGGHGISQLSNNGESNLDGYCTDNLISNVGLDAINYARGAGWIFRRMHIYGVQGNAIKISNAFSTTVTENIVEDFGRANVAAAFYYGITISILDLWGCHITNNFVSCTEPSTNAVAAYTYISINASNGATDANAVVTGNIVHGPTVPGTKGIGMAFDNNGGGAILHLRHGQNRISNVDTRILFAGSSTRVYQNDLQGNEHILTQLPGTAGFGGSARGTGASTPVLTGNDFGGKITFATGTSPTTGVLGGITFGRNFANAPTVILTPGNAATAALQLYATPGTGSCDIGVGVAPAASQVSGTYVVYYQVIG